ncbi:MAG: peptide deformylase [Bacteroidota bacterium]
MILPVVAYGHPVLNKKAREIDTSFPDLKGFIDNMFDTMYQSDGVGLAAPQVNQSVRLFVVDCSPFSDKYLESENFKRVFINATIYMEDGEDWAFNEGCLSFPGLREDITRKPVIWMTYLDENLQPHDERFDGINARVIQHEYDHIEGVVFVDRMSSLRKMIIKGRLSDIAKGKVDVAYKMLFPLMKKRR